MQPTPELALHRFGLGARPGDVGKLGDPKAWLARQIAPQPEPQGFAAFPRAAQILRDLPDLKDLKQDQEALKAYRKGVREAAIAGRAARCEAGFASDTPFYERLVWFWSNHFAVSISAKERVALFAFDFERSAIRPNVTGTFADMLIATARHPAMLIYLDNAQSAGPNSRAGTNRGVGLNENYAREVMELHTMGVGSGYSQDDIIALAKILSGWSVRGRQAPEGDDPFFFAANRHEPGDKLLLGASYAEGEAAGRAALTALARHPATAKRIARKFAAHFTTDTPDPALVSRLTDIFHKTDGDLGALAKGLVNDEAAWDAPLTKARDPVQFVTAAIRATRGTAGQALPEPAQKRLLGALKALGEVPFEAPSPQGWPDDLASWFGPDQVVARVEWALALAGKIPQQIDPAQLASDLLGSLLSADTKTMVARAASPQEGLAMLIASPEFMRR